MNIHTASYRSDLLHCINKWCLIQENDYSSTQHFAQTWSYSGSYITQTFSPQRIVFTYAASIGQDVLPIFTLKTHRNSPGFDSQPQFYLPTFWTCADPRGHDTWIIEAGTAFLSSRPSGTQQSHARQSGTL